MKINILTLFPTIYDGFKDNSIIKKAIGKGILELNIIDIRSFSLDKNFRVDSPPIGGGAGLIMQCQPLVDALNSIEGVTHKILLSPKGDVYNQKKAISLSKLDNITLICGHYEGIDYRFNDYIDEEISVGDYILTGGETASYVVIDSITRLLEGTLNSDSLQEETFSEETLEYPQYALPRIYEGKKVPEILFCGNHKIINKYRRKESLKLTQNKRPDLFKKIKLNKEDLKLLDEINQDIEISSWEKDAIEKGKKFIK